MIKTVTNKEYSLVHNDTGEIVEFKQVKKVKQEEFMLLFLAAAELLNQLDGTSIKILIFCWKYSTFNNNVEKEGNLIYNNVYFKDKLRESGLTYSNNTINIYIGRLCKKNLLIKKGGGVYMLNPEYFFKGTLNDRSKLRMTLETE